jgi:hypothetical protein
MPLELEQQLVFRRRALRRLDENHLDPVASELLNEQNLVGVFAAEAVRRVHEDCLNLSLGGQIAQPFQTRAHEAGAAEAFILEDPFTRNVVAVVAGKFDQRRRLARNRVLFLLLVRGYPGVDRGGLHCHPRSMEACD